MMYVTCLFPLTNIPAMLAETDAFDNNRLSFFQLYQKMADLYTAKEAAKAVELYADHIEIVMRDHLDMTGLLGSTLHCVPQIPLRLHKAIH